METVGEITDVSEGETGCLAEFFDPLSAKGKPVLEEPIILSMVYLYSCRDGELK